MKFRRRYQVVVGGGLGPGRGPAHRHLGAPLRGGGGRGGPDRALAAGGHPRRRGRLVAHPGHAGPADRRRGGARGRGRGPPERPPARGRAGGRGPGPAGARARPDEPEESEQGEEPARAPAEPEEPDRAAPRGARAGLGHPALRGLDHTARRARGARARGRRGGPLPTATLERWRLRPRTAPPPPAGAAGTVAAPSGRSWAGSSWRPWSRCWPSGCSTATSTPDPGRPRGGRAARDAPALHRCRCCWPADGIGPVGTQVSLDDLRGRTVVSTSGPPGAPPCEREAPVLDEVARHYRGTGDDVVVLGVDVAGPERERARRSRRGHGVPTRRCATAPTRPPATSRSPACPRPTSSIPQGRIALK